MKKLILLIFIISTSLLSFAQSNQTVKDMTVKRWFIYRGDTVSFTGLTVSGLERLTEGGQTGWRPIGRNPLYYGNIGNQAFDFSYSNTNSSVYGATGNYSMAFGYKTQASGIYSIAGGFNSKALSDNSFAWGNYVEAAGNYNFAIGKYTETDDDASFSGGLGSSSLITTKAFGRVSFNYSESSSKSSDAGADNSAILGGIDNVTTSGANKSAIIGGNLNTIGALGVQSTIIGGDSITLNLPDVVAVPRLMIAKDEVLPTGSYTGTLSRDLNDSLWYYHSGAWQNLTRNGGAVGVDTTDVWSSEGGVIRYPYGANINALYAGDDSATLIEQPYLGKVFRKAYSDKTNYTLYGVRLNDSLFRVIASYETEIKASMYNGNPDSINNALANNWQVKSLLIDTLVIMTADWYLPDSIEISKTINGLITGSFNIVGNETNINIGDEQIFNTNVTQTGTWKADKIYPELFGAVGDGTTDDLTPLSKLFAFAEICTYNKIEFSPNKQYYHQADLTYNFTKTVNIEGNGATLITSFGGDLTTKGALQLKNNVEITGTTGKTVAANIVKDAVTVTLSNTTNLTAGMIFQIKSNEIYGSESLADPEPVKKEFLTRIKSISGSVITVMDAFPFPFDYTQVVSVKFYNDIPVYINKLNFKIINEPTVFQRVHGLNLENVHSSLISNCNSINAYNSFRLEYCYNTTLDNCNVPTKAPYVFSSTSRYGLSVAGTTNATIKNSYFTANGHATTMTTAPSVNIKFDNIYANPVFDSHSSYSVTVSNSDIYFSWFNFGTVVFDNCEMHPAPDINWIFQQRWCLKSDLDVTIQNSRIYGNDNSTSQHYIFYPGESLKYGAESLGKFSLINNIIKVNSTGGLMIWAGLSLDSIADVDPNRNNGGNALIIEGNRFVGTSEVKLSKHYSGQANRANRGDFIFRNNTYRNLNITDLNYELWDNYIIEGNKPLRDESKMSVDLASYPDKVIFNNNKIQTDDFKIYTTVGEISLTNNRFVNAKGVELMKVNKLSGNTSNGYPIFDSKAPDNFYDFASNASNLATSVTLSGLSTWTLNVKAKLNNNGSGTFQAIWGADNAGTARTKYTLQYNSSGNYLRLQLRNLAGDYGTFDYYNFTPDTLWHTFTGYMDISTTDTAHVLLIDGLEFARTSFPAAKYPSGTYLWTTMYATGTIDIGNHGTSLYHYGKIASASIYNRKLSQEEISSIVNNDSYQFTGCLGNWGTGKTATSWIDGVGTTNLTMTPSSQALKFNEKYNSFQNISSSGKFSYGDNAYGTAYYSGAGVTLSTSGTTTRQTVTGMALDSDSKNVTFSSNKIILGKTGKYEVTATITMKNATAVCNTYNVFSELHNSGGTLLKSSNSGAPKDCTTDAFKQAPDPVIFNSTGTDDYISLTVAGDGSASNVVVTSVSVMVRKIDE